MITINNLMNRDQIIELFTSKPRHAGRMLASNSSILNSPGSSIPEKAYNYCYPGSIEKFNGCLYCKKKFKNFISFNQGYRHYCSPKCAMNAPEIKQQREESCLERYGVKNPLSTTFARQRLKEVSLERYGTTTPVASREVQDKVKKNLLQTYGVDHAFKVDAIKQKAKERHAEKYAADRWPIRLELIESSCNVTLIGDRAYRGEGAKYEWKHSCGTTFTSSVSSGSILSCPNCKVNFTSEGERELKSFIEQFVQVESQVRGIIAPYELDIFIPSLNLAFEYDGDYYHSTDVKNDKNYHLKKLNKCEQKGIKLINIFEHQWRSRRKIIESRIKSLLGMSLRIYARNCEIVEVDELTASKFLEENHLQGSVRSSRRIGLTYNGELVSLMTFGSPRFNLNYEWELLRFCNKLDLTVVGGASKLFSHANYQSLISYADRCWSNGDLYRQLKMEELTPSPPSYFYVKGQQRLSRYQAQKHKLKDLLGDQFSPELTESENMKAAKYYQIYDCGHRVFHLNKEA